MAASGERVTYRALEDAANRFAHLLRARGLQAGDHLAILIENNARLFEVCWGAQRIGIVYTLVNTRLTAGEAAYIIEDCQAKLLVTSYALRPVAAELIAQTPQLTQRLMIDGTIQGYQSYEEHVASQPATAIEDPCAGYDMFYSSGTTGRPKGIVPAFALPRFDSETPLTELCRAFYSTDANTVYLSPAPLYHAAPLRFSMSVMRLGGTVIVMERFDPLEYLRQIERFRVTHSQLVPT